MDDLGLFRPMDETLYQGMSHFWSQTGIKPDTEDGAVIRSLFEAVGFRIEDISYVFQNVVREAILQGVFEAFGVDKQQDTYATTQLRLIRNLNVSQPLTIPEGVLAVRPDGIAYQTISPLIFAPGIAEASATARCTTPGTVGNSGINTITRLQFSLPNISSVTNFVLAQGGQDEETLEQQKARFALFIAELHRGTPLAIAARALRTVFNGVKPREVLVLDAVTSPSIIPGHSHIYLDDGFGTVSNGMISAVYEALKGGYVASGIRHSVYAVTPHVINIRYSTDSSADLNNVFLSFFLASKIGQKLSYENLVTALTVAAGSEITLISPAADVNISQTHRPVIGTITKV